jgi:hypothetical protein
VAVDPETEAREAEKRRKRAEKKARKKDEKRREKAEATASTSFTPSAQPPVASDAVPVPRDDVDDVSVSAGGVRLETTSAETTTPTPEARRAGDDKKTSANSALRPRGARVSTRGEPGLVFGLTEEQRSWVAVAIALVAMCVLAIAGRIGGARA